LANFAHLDNQSDSEKKAKRHSKALGEKRSNPGSFWFTAVGASFFQRHKNFRVAILAAEWHKQCTSSIDCVSLLSYSIAVNIRRLQCNMSKQQANVFQTTRAGAWYVWLIWYVPAALLRLRRAPKKLLVSAGN
jgi:hypothetical protein